MDNVINKKFNELTVKAFIDKPETDKYKAWGGPWVRCECSCNKYVDIPLYGVTNGYIKSCGHIKGNNGRNNLNTYRKNHKPANSTIITYDNKSMNIAEWSRFTGIPRTTIMYRIENGWPMNKVFETGENDG